MQNYCWCNLFKQNIILYNVGSLLKYNFIQFWSMKGIVIILCFITLLSCEKANTSLSSAANTRCTNPVNTKLILYIKGGTSGNVYREQIYSSGIFLVDPNPPIGDFGSGQTTTIYIQGCPCGNNGVNLSEYTIHIANSADTSDARSLNGYVILNSKDTIARQSGKGGKGISISFPEPCYY